MKETIRYIRYVFREMFSCSKGYVFISIFVKIFSLLETYLLLYLGKLILNSITFAIASGETGIVNVVKIMLIGVSIEISTMVLFNVWQYHLGKMKLKYEDVLIIKLAKSLSVLDMSYYDDPEAYNETKQAGKCKSAILDSFTNYLNLFFYILSFVVAISVMLSFNILLTFFILLAAIPAYIVRKKNKTKQHVFERELIQEQRYVDYLIGLYFHKNVEMEMQLYNFHPYVESKVDEHQETIRNKKLKFSREQAYRQGGLTVFDKIATILKQIWIVAVVISKKLTIGDYSYSLGIANNLSSSLINIIDSASNISVCNIKLDEYLKIINRKPKIENSGTRRITLGSIESIEFRNVSFRYPNASQYALHELSFKITAGEKIAFVGPNGAGKSTLIKLILRYYDPTSGEILLNGINIKEFDLVSYRSLFSTMFQEQILYLFSIYDNIRLSDVTQDLSLGRNKANNLLSAFRIDQIYNQPVNLDEMYGKEFSKTGYVFSKGQQQRLQAARTLFRECDFYILDEPSASMDVMAEHDFLNVLEQNISDKTILYVTHHYNNLNVMDNIIVLCNGTVVEEGKHNELISRAGLYAKMFNLDQRM